MGKVGEARRATDAVELISSGKVDLVVNTPRGRGPRADGAHIRRAATARGSRASPPWRRRWPRRPGSSSGSRPRRPSARCRSTTATASSGSRSDAGAVADRSTSTRRASAGLALPNPIVAASGTFGHGDEVARLGDPARLGAVTAKSLSPEPWAGNPRAAAAHDRGGDGQRGRAPGSGRRALGRARPPRAARAPARASIASVWGRTVDDFARAREMLAAAPTLVAVEVNVSCPNLDDRDARCSRHDPTRPRAVVARGASTPASASRCSPSSRRT